MNRVAILAGLFAFSGCTIWFALEGDPGDLPCADEAPFCLDGYTCIEEQTGDRLCRLAAALEEGQACNADTECVPGLVCADAYEEANCPEEERELDPNCRNGFTGQKTCRQTCNPEEAASQCPLGQVCFPDALGSGFCQGGVCTQNADCGNNDVAGLANICGNLANGEGSGFCLNSCRPFECDPLTGICDDCPSLDADGDGAPDRYGCVPAIINNQLIPDRFGCIAIVENFTAGTGCQFEDSCTPGTFCTTQLTGQQGICSEYCSGDGNPACNVGACTGQIQADIGFCQ
jgi:hypothetical protein